MFGVLRAVRSYRTVVGVVACCSVHGTLAVRETCAVVGAWSARWLLLRGSLYFPVTQNLRRAVCNKDSRLDAESSSHLPAERRTEQNAR